MVLTGHSAGIWKIAPFPGGRYLASAGNDGLLILWNILEGRPVAEFAADAAIRDCAVTPDGLTVVAGDAQGRVHFLTAQYLVPGDSHDG